MFVDERGGSGKVRQLENYHALIIFGVSELMRTYGVESRRVHPCRSNADSLISYGLYLPSIPNKNYVPSDFSSAPLSVPREHYDTPVSIAAQFNCTY